MLKDKLAEAVLEAAHNNKLNDSLPLGIRGELEVIAKDRDGNLISYERGHNQVTNLAKMAIVHLLAGEIGTADSDVYSVKDSAKQLSTEDSGTAKINQRFVKENHTTEKNDDGHLVSGEGFFYNGEGVTDLNQVNLNGEPNLFANYPTKMLFGTGIEASDASGATEVYGAEIGNNVILQVNGYESGKLSDMFSGADDMHNWYSAGKKKTRTLQPITTDPIATPLSADTTAIKGAIKNGLVFNNSDVSNINVTTGAGMPATKGFGYPCFIYAKRTTNGFYDISEGNTNTHYQVNDAINNSSVYETELTYTVTMPAQPTGNDVALRFYPYNGWIIKQAGLFSDSKYLLRSQGKEDSGMITEYNEYAKAGGDPAAQLDAYGNSVGGQLMFVRNLSSPILKTPDIALTFVWHIFISI